MGNLTFLHHLGILLGISGVVLLVWCIGIISDEFDDYWMHTKIAISVVIAIFTIFQLFYWAVQLLTSS